MIKRTKRVPPTIKRKCKSKRWKSSIISLHRHGCCLLPLIIQEESPVTHGNPLIKKKNKYETTLCEESPWEQITGWVKKVTH